jgi:C1A family cysteine protease
MSDEKSLFALKETISRRLEGAVLPVGIGARLRRARSTIEAGLQTGLHALAPDGDLGRANEALHAMDLADPASVAQALDLLSVAMEPAALQIDPRFNVRGWIRDTPDPRDQLYSAPLALLKALPSSVDLRAGLPEPYDQGRIGSCTANAIAAAVEFARRDAGQQPDFLPSRMFIYYIERAVDDAVRLDNGAQLRTGMNAIAKDGVCREDLWRYDDTPADPRTHIFPAGARAAETPSPASYGEARTHVAISYWRLNQALAQLRGCLAEGFPFVFGFVVYGSFFDGQRQPRAVIPMPSSGDVFVGRHAVTAVGYDDAAGTFLIRNSWGPGVQDEGHFHMPYAYLIDPQLCADFWTVRAIVG